MVQWLIPLQVTDLRKVVIVKRLSLYVNYAVTFSIHKVYIPINSIHIYYIHKDYFLYRPTWTNGPYCLLRGCADRRRTRSCKKVVCILEATSFLSLSVSASVSVSHSLLTSRCWERTIDSDAIQERKAR
uniref:Uncharacterized protein n=1 Tax=Myotis myotis TaxID=51298 RepID=A0A7J7S245_MYOMY|nr:hypothetical protein mMyoMyo1_010098 [Myotis myotis]